jgi:Tol biopolymer transport system component
MLKYSFIIFCLIFTALPASEARVYLDINAPTFVQIPIVLPKWKSVDKTPPSLSEKVYEILANDLILSGFFKVIDVHHLPPSLQGKEGIPNTPFLREWIPAGGEILLAGEALLDANGLNFKLKFHLIDLVEQKYIVGKQYEGPLQTLRSAIHRIAGSDSSDYGERHNTKIAMRSAEEEKKFSSLISTGPMSNRSPKPIHQSFTVWSQTVKLSPLTSNEIQTST